MIKDTNVQKSVVIPRDIAEKIKQEAQKNYCSESTMIKQILIEYFKNK